MNQSIQHGYVRKCCAHWGTLGPRSDGPIISHSFAWTEQSPYIPVSMAFTAIGEYDFATGAQPTQDAWSNKHKGSWSDHQVQCRDVTAERLQHCWARAADGRMPIHHRASRLCVVTGLLLMCKIWPSVGLAGLHGLFTTLLCCFQPGESPACATPTLLRFHSLYTIRIFKSRPCSPRWISKHSHHRSRATFCNNATTKQTTSTPKHD